MSSESSDTFEKRAQKAMLQHAFFRWESAVVIALTLMLAVFGSLISAIDFVPVWLWLLGGLLAEGALVYSSYTDQETGRKVVAEMLREEFHPEHLQNKELRRQMEQALDYRSRIMTNSRERRDSVLTDSLVDTANQIDIWLENIYNLAFKLDRYYDEQEVLQRDTKRAQRRIEQLDQRIKLEADPKVQQEIEATLSSQRKQVETNETIEKTMDRAQLRLEATLSKLGTIYSQTMLVGAKDIDSSRAKRLSQDINEEVQELDSILLALDEVYADGSQS
jgi:hypothetical protein